eukprot:TRINITY_DN1780_c0_g3_i11.p1 TRINITY_DN1780_c0_g3~~TRINITY_DN1780_c0_g3_i11.p1  ORF type:complete len:190 (+),score=41.58 TRINITY_DN1780_c0_g3_i11:140-709(+)
MNRVRLVAQPLKASLRAFSGVPRTQIMPAVTVPFASFSRHTHPVSWAVAKPVKGERDLFDVFFKGFSSKPLETFFEDDTQTPNEVWRPRSNVKETEDATIISVEMPGLSKEDVKIKITNNELVVSGEKKLEKKDDQSSTVIERSYSRKFNLDERVQASSLTAKMEHGILTISIPHPKEEPEKVTDVQIS